MSKNLVIVESPAKAKTIEKFLGKDYKVMSSYGHIRDLRKKDFSLDTSNFEPEYEIPSDKKQVVDQLKKASKEAETVWLASDEDREGEAIAWHLQQVLGLDPATTKRIVFHEITKDAILHAIANPRSIDIDRVNAQQARRVLDRIVGFELSPVLWKKVKPALSAGRVQSVAVRLIVEREQEINNFVPETYFRVTARFTDPEGNLIKGELSRRVATPEEARKLLEDLKGATYSVADVQVKPVKKSPAPPFTTSTLQQAAARQLGFTVSQTMMVAQKLYEAGHITYMRTDSLNLSQLAINTIRDEITSHLGKEYVKTRQYHTSSKGAQEAHEAIRPTYASKRTIDGTPREKKLYELIWKRTVASQMADAVLEKTTVDIQPSTRPEHFKAEGEVVKFDGFLKVYFDDTEAVEAGREGAAPLPSAGILPPVSIGETLSAQDVNALQRFTQQPPRYTEGSLVKKMEDLGIGRPSTYAPTISTIQDREYVTKGDRGGEEREVTSLDLVDGKIKETVRKETFGSEKGKLVPTDIGIVVNDFLTSFFPDILDYNFTANVEQTFDEIAEGKAPWQQELHTFYDTFHPSVEKANGMRMEHKVGERLLGTDPASGKPVSVKVGRYGTVVQIGSVGADEKPRFASLKPDQSIFDITLDEALKLFDLPRSLGDFEGAEMTVASGRFGPYVKHAGKFVSIPKTMDPLTITADEAQELILAKREADSRKLIKEFDEEPEMKILNGRFGPYISYEKKNYKLPKSIDDPAAVTIEQAREIIAAAADKPRRARRK